MSAEEHRLAADEEVYAVVAERRAEIGSGGSFTIDPPAVGLRAELYAAAAGGALPSLPPLGFLECLDIAAENSRAYQERRERLYLAALDLTLERWRFGVQPEASAALLASGEGDDGETQSLGMGLGFAKLFGSGAEIIGDIGLEFANTLSSGDGFQAIGAASLSVSQPLLRGFGDDVVLEPLTQAERDVLYEARDYERFRRTLAFDVAERLFRIAQQHKTLINEERNYESLVVIRQRNEAFAEAGQLLDLEVDQALQDELRSRARVVEAERTLDALYDEFKLFLGLPVETELLVRAEELEGLFGLVVPEVEFDEATAAAVALAERLDHKSDWDRQADAERDVEIAADALRPGLGLVASAAAASEAGQPLDFAEGSVPWSVGLDLDLALDRLPERNGYRAALIARAAAQRAAEEASDRVRADVRDALRGLAAAREQVAIQENAVRLAERRVESSRMQQEAGRADTRDLLESQEALLQAQNGALQASVDFTLANLALYRDMELLRVDDGGLWVELGPIEQEAGE
jgi:outer membrane protein TolC